MLTTKQQNRNYWDWQNWGRRLHCTKCGVYMKDLEPMCAEGEFMHPSNGCANGGLRFDFEPPRNRKNTYWGARKKGIIAVSGIEQVMKKKDRRARRRGARLDSKHRPR